MVTVKGFAKDTCVICDRASECFEADFGKLKGSFCRGCFTKLCRNRTVKKEVEVRRDETPQPGSQPQSGAK